MQTLREIRDILDQAQLSPNRQFGQCFLYDQNLMAKLLGLAEIQPESPVLEVGSGTGSLTEELLERASKVVAVEIDHGLCRVLRDRLASRSNFELIEADALEGKHRLNRQMCERVAPRAQLISNLPYNVATPLLLQMLTETWRRTGAPSQGTTGFFRMTFTVQKEVADRFVAHPGCKNYGPVSILAALLARVKMGPMLPPSAFWPRPKVDSRMVRLDYDPSKASKLIDLPLLQAICSGLFSQRRKQAGKLARGLARNEARFLALPDALEQVGVDPTSRPEQIAPEAFLQVSNRIASESGR
jgi:16S rRNA (adenine1518-N6/adenine1519-N6)-dimethyltransferase